MHRNQGVNVYGDGKCVQNTIGKFADRVKGRHGVVIGTMYPWLEAILLGNFGENLYVYVSVCWCIFAREPA